MREGADVNPDLLSCAIFSLSEISTVLTTASAFFLACSVFFSIYNNTHKVMRHLDVRFQSLFPFKPLHVSPSPSHSHPSLFASFGLCQSLNWTCVDLLPLLLVLLHHFSRDRDRFLPVLPLVLQEPHWNLASVLRAGEPKAKTEHIVELSSEPEHILLNSTKLMCGMTAGQLTGGRIHLRGPCVFSWTWRSGPREPDPQRPGSEHAYLNQNTTF